MDLRESNKLYLEITLSKIKLGSEEAFILVIQDISEKNALYQEVELALEKSQESAKLKSEFLASMSHEIRTPMNGVIGMADLMADSDLTPAQNNYIQTIRDSAEVTYRPFNTDIAAK